MDFGQIFKILFDQPIANILMASYTVLHNYHVPFAFGFSIIILTVAIRIILYPIMSAQIKMGKKMQEMNPHLSAIKEKHKDDKKKQQEEIMKLYKEFNVNPASGCLPLLIQMPVLFSLFHVLNLAVNGGDKNISQINSLIYFDWMKLRGAWDLNFFGISLGAVPSKEISIMPLLILIPVITGVLQFVMTKMMAPENPPKKTEKEDDFQTTFSKQSLYIFPIMIGFMAFNFPVGLSLYWNVSSFFGILQQYFQAGPGGLKKYLPSSINNYGKRK